MKNEIDIKELRKARGWTQQEMGQHMGVDHQTIWRWENEGIPTRGTSPRMIELLWKETFGTEATQ